MVNETKLKTFYHSKEVDEKSSTYFLQEIKIEQMENQLLGEFQADGKYVVSDEILKILASLFKTIKKQDDSRLELEAKCGNVVFKFFVDFGNLGRGTKYATLKFVENFSSFVGDNAEDLITPVLYYKDDDDIYFMTKVKKLFNIVSSDESEGKNKQNEDLAKVLLDKKAKMKAEFERYLQISKNKDKLYVKKMLLLLDNSGEFGKFILRRYKILSHEFSKFLDPKKNDYYRNLKKLLDKIILNEKNRPKEFDEMLGKLRTSYSKVNYKILKIATEPPKKIKEEIIKLGKGLGGVKFNKSKAGSNPKSKSKTSTLPPTPFNSNTSKDNEISELSEDSISNYMKQSLEKIYESINKNAVEKDFGRISIVEDKGEVIKNNDVENIKIAKENIQEL